MSWACLEITALWERWARVPPDLALGTGSHFLSIKVPAFLAQPDGSPFFCRLKPSQASCSWERGCVQPVCRDNVLLYLKMYSARKDSSFVVALLSVDTGPLQMEGVCKASLAQPPLGRLSQRWEKTTLTCKSWHVKGLLSQGHFKPLFQN